MDAEWNELERGNTGASRLCKSSPNDSRIERLYPKLVEVREMKKAEIFKRHLFIGYNQDDFLIVRWIWSEYGE